jgi:iron(III) transport system substrate-binding protein
LEQELALPAAVLEGARREGKVSIISSWDPENARPFLASFKKRYPEIEPEFQEANEEVRTVRTLTEIRAGRNRHDIITNFAGFIAEYKSANALIPLNDLPAYPNYDVPFRDPDHLWASDGLTFWALGYNSDNVKPDQLPKTWEDLANPRWKGRIGLGDRPNLWAQAIWKEWGAARTTDLLKRIFANQPQRRKEGMDALANLLAAGEFDIAIPASTSRIERTRARNAPVGWFALDPMLVSAGDLGQLRGPNPNAGKVFINWYMSREGNGLFAEATSGIPSHPALRADKKYLGDYADAVASIPWSVREPQDENTILPEVRKVWNELFLS